MCNPLVLREICLRYMYLSLLVFRATSSSSPNAIVSSSISKGTYKQDREIFAEGASSVRLSSLRQGYACNCVLMTQIKRRERERERKRRVAKWSPENTVCPRPLAREIANVIINMCEFSFRWYTYGKRMVERTTFSHLLSPTRTITPGSSVRKKTTISLNGTIECFGETLRLKNRTHM